MNAAALSLASLGIPVFPCKWDKKPHTFSRFKEATTDLAVIRGWWSRWPDALIGVRSTARLFAKRAVLISFGFHIAAAALIALAAALNDAGRIGAVGYCMSGPFVMWAAADFPQRLRCIASIHGANMVTDRPDSPHRMAPRIRCESYFACAETDKWAPPADIEMLLQALQAAGTPHRVEWYPGVEHGFVFPQRGAIYDQAAAERHWERLFSLFERTLKRADGAAAVA